MACPFEEAAPSPEPGRGDVDLMRVRRKGLRTKAGSLVAQLRKSYAGDGDGGPEVQDSEQAPWPGRMPADAPVVDWSQPSEAVARLINANKFGAVGYTRGVKWALAEAAPAAMQGTAEPGTILSADGELLVAASDGAVKIGRFCAETGRHNWIYRNDLAGILRQLPASARFERERFPDVESVVVRHEFSIHHLPASGKEADFFPSIYAANREWLTGLFGKLGLKPGARFLDIGCSGSPWTAFIARDFGLEAWGCDLLPPDHFPWPWFHYFVADATRMPELPTAFDLILFRGLPPVNYPSNLNAPELALFRDRMVEGLSATGAIYAVVQSNNTGRRRNPDDWANHTLGAVKDWFGLPHCEAGRSNYLSVLASRGPIAQPWLQTAFAEDRDADLAGDWRHFRDRFIDERTYVHVLMKVTQAMWPLTDFRSPPRAWVSGTGRLAEDLLFVLQRNHTNIKAAMLEPGRVEPDHFVFVLPGSEDAAEWPCPSYRVSHGELMGRAAARDLYCVDGDHDFHRLSYLLSQRTAARQQAETPSGGHGR